MDDRVLGEKIRLARSRIGLSQEELGERINKDQKAISKYELGQRRMFATDIPKLAQALDVPIWFFFEETIPAGALDYEIRKQVDNLPNQEARAAALELLRWFSNTLHDQLQPMGENS